MEEEEPYLRPDACVTKPAGQRLGAHGTINTTSKHGRPGDEKKKERKKETSTLTAWHKQFTSVFFHVWSLQAIFTNTLNTQPNQL